MDRPAEPDSEVDLKKKEVKYKGVRYRKSGKFAAEIGDPKKRGRVWLGTYLSAIEAAKAFDKASFEMHGRNASLNFPLEYGISPAESDDVTMAETDAVITDGRKRTRDVGQTVAVVKTTDGKHDGDDSSPVDAIKLYDGSGPSSSPSAAHGSRPSLSPPLQSLPNGNFKWTDQSLCAMYDILNKQISKNGRNCPFVWADHQLELEKVIHHKFRTTSALRNKYDAMRARYNLWKSLKNGETSLHWNESTGKLDCSDDWWEKKIKENPEFKLIQKNQPSRELQEAWDLLFENVVANGPECVAPCVDINKLNKVDHVNLEDEDVSSERAPNSSQFGNMETENAPSFSNFVKEASQEDGLAPNQGDGCKPSQKAVKTNDNHTMKNSEMRESERATLHKEFVTRQNATQQSCLKILKTSNVNQVGDSSISASVDVINRMSDKGLMTACSELWCFAVNLFEDDVKRELFMSLPNDVGRLAWLQYKQNLGN